MDTTAVVWTPTPHPHRIATISLIAGKVHVSGSLGLTALPDSPSPAPTPGLPPQLAALIPPRDPRNSQRRIVSTLMDRAGIELRGRPALEQDWLTLLYCGRDGIGALDVFESDADAERYYGKPDRPEPSESELLPALIRMQRGQASPADTELILAQGPVAGVPGAMPKWLGREWLYKFESSAYPGLLALEDLAYEIHRRAGFEVPETRLLAIDGVPVLASRRFDRRLAHGRAVAVESMYSVWATEYPSQIRCNTDGSMELMADTFREYGLPVLEWYGRYVLAILTGNGDMHSENVSLLARDDQVQLSPIYDPAPMRAYRGRDNHDLLSALPCAGIGGTTSSGYRPYADSGDTPPDLRDRLVQLGVYAGIDAAVAEGEIDRLLAVSAGYAESVPAHLILTLPGGYQGRAPDVRGFQATLDAVARACR